MKKTVLTLLLVIFLAAAFCSCNVQPGEKPSTGGDGSGNDGGTSGDTDFIYSENSELNLVYDPAGISPDNAFLLKDTLQGAFNGKLTVLDNDSPVAEHEIVVGKSDRAISVTAYRLLERMDKEEESEVRYLIYSNGTSIAIAYDDAYWGLAAAEVKAVDYFINNVVNHGSLTVRKGVVSSELFDSIAWQKSIDAVFVEEEWQRLKLQFSHKTTEAHAEEIVAALQDMYLLYSEDIVSWIANLYDPAVGGFYYSNSARDTEGFLPDLESTYQLLGLPTSLGMTEGKSVGDFYPKEMADAIVAWVKGLQDAENGYFYHPQWGKSFTDQIPNRRGRDLQWAERILAYFGANPTYDTPNGVEGDGVLASGASVLPLKTRVTGSLSVPITVAVSRVVLTANDDAGVTPHLRTDVAFKEYLSSLNINGDSYTVGNLLESQATQIVARDKVLASRGEKYRLADILHKWLNDHQNAKTGLWTLDGSKDYSAVNGLLKIGSTYNKLGKAIPNTDKALDAAILCASSSEKPNHICDVLNPLYAISELKTNISRYNSGSSSRWEIEEANNRLLEDAVNIVKVTADKVAMFRKDDGSFSYYPTQTAASSQGATVALVNTNEGDANTVNIATAAIPGHLFAALGISDKIEFCTKADGVRYLSILENLGAVIKDSAVDERDSASGTYVRKYGGEYYPESFRTQQVTTLYRASSYIACNDEAMSNSEQERIRIISDEDKGTGILEYSKSTSPSTHGFAIRRTGTQAGGNCFVFETEIKLGELDGGAMSGILEQKQPVLLSFTPGAFESATSANVLSSLYREAFASLYIEERDGEYYSFFSHATKPYQYISYGKEQYNGNKLRANKRFTVTVELYDNGMAKYFVDNKYIEEVRLYDNTESFFTTLDLVKINLGNKAVSSSVYFDNTFVGTVEKEYVPGDAIRTYDYIGPGNYGVSYGGLDYDVEKFHVLQQKGYVTRATWNTVCNEEGKSYSDTGFHREFARISEITREGAVQRVLEFGARTTNAKGIYMRETNVGEGNSFVFETEFLLDVDEKTANNICKLGAAPIFYFNIGKSIAASSVPATDTNYTGTELARIYVNKASDGNLRYYFNAPVGKAYMACTAKAEITSGWHTLTMEIFSNGTVRYYVDGNLLGEAKALSSQDVSKFNELNSVKLSINDALDNSYFFLDNTYITRMEITYTPSSPDSGSDNDGEGGEEAGDIDSPFDGDNVDDGGWG